MKVPIPHLAYELLERDDEDAAWEQGRHLSPWVKRKLGLRR